MTFDWSTIFGDGTTGKAPSVAMTPVGKYECRVKEANVETAGSGAVMIAMVLEIANGPNEGDWLWNNLVFPKADSKPGHSRMWMRAMNALGFSEQYLNTERPTPERIAAEMVGRSVVANVTHRMWEGEERANVKSLHPAGAADDTPPMPAIGGAPVASTTDELPPPPIPVVPDEADTDTDQNETPF